MTKETSESKSRASKVVQSPKKQCVICKKRKPLTDFYTNAEWTDEQGVDRWCKECVGKITTKEALKEYFWENRREWSEDFWNAALKIAEKRLANNDLYNRSSDDRRKVLLDRTAVQSMALPMTKYYKFIKLSPGEQHISYGDAIALGKIEVDAEDPNLKEYSEFFNGYFNQRELKYLTDYYNKLEEDFSFDNENLRDYAKKCARASLQADKAQDDYAAGRCSFADVKDALTQFDMLSKSANFAACKRKTGETSGLTSWSETTLYLETHGYCKEATVEWPKDDVDLVIAELQHTVKALGLDSI